MKSIHSIILLCTTTFLCACSQISDAMKDKPAYIGTPPPAVKLYSPDHIYISAPNQMELPPSNEQSSGAIRYNQDGIPYGKASQYKDCINSPYSPYRRLSTQGFSSGQTVYDPYDGRPFILP